MSLFQCDLCGCVENTACCSQGHKPPAAWFDWTGIEDRAGKRLCSACGPETYSDGQATKDGSWHGQFERVFLPLGMFVTNEVGNLAHKETGETDYRKYALPPNAHVQARLRR